MEKLRQQLHTVAPWLIWAFSGLSLALFFYLAWSELVFSQSLLQAQSDIQKLDENNSKLSDWVDEQPEPGWEAEMTPVNINGMKLLPPPPPVDMAKLKNQGCVADGFLSGYGGDINSSIALINRSDCYYLHRALETWLKPPDFELARKIQERVTKPNTVYGMFLAEAIDTKEDYYYPYEDRNFKFRQMCRDGTIGAWGEHTCKPSLKQEEYRKYLTYITQQAMDMGVQVFMFGEVFYQDNPDMDKTQMPEVIASMRQSAADRGLQIVIGAQTNDIDDPNYLKLFDFVEGGVGLHTDGTIEDGPCFSRWYQNPGDWCWALLWNERFKSQANNVLVHLDWSGKIGDDMSVFTRMSQEERLATLKSLQAYFRERDVGFMMPLLATLQKENGGCHGKKDRYYSASRKYTCQDEDGINALLKQGKHSL